MEIASNSISEAWGQAFKAIYEQREISPLVVTVSGLEGMPQQEDDFRSDLDEKLVGWGCKSTGTTASTLFPWSLWDPASPRDQFYERYQRIYPRLLECPNNRKGTYFSRLIGVPDGTNQLERIITDRIAGQQRRSAFVASVYDPNSDYTRGRQLGFPCMHQVCFSQEKDNGWSVTGFYAKQLVIERAYGNYLGLARLGHFVASAVGSTLTRVTCVAAVAGRGNRPPRKADLKDLYDSI